jgi:hypothetical protein
MMKMKEKITESSLLEAEVPSLSSGISPVFTL